MKGQNLFPLPFKFKFINTTAKRAIVCRNPKFVIEDPVYIKHNRISNNGGKVFFNVRVIFGFVDIIGVITSQILINGKDNIYYFIIDKHIVGRSNYKCTNIRLDVNVLEKINAVMDFKLFNEILTAIRSKYEQI